MLGRAGPLLLPGAVILAVLATAFAAIPPIRDAATLEPVTEAALRLSPGYLLMAPLSNVLDVVTLLSVRQHVALLLTLLGLYVAWWGLRGGWIPHTVLTVRRGARIIARIGLAVLVPVVLYGLAILLPRPMARLETAPDVLAVDFHSHTKYSHDGRPDWSAEDNRAWHRDAGYAAAYVTDHRTFEGIHDGWANNPALAGDGTSLLPAIEVGWHGEHVNVLDAERMYRGILTPTLRDLDDEALRLASLIPANEPVLIETLPGRLDSLVAATGSGTAGLRAIEIVDGAPRGLGQTRRERARIAHLADSLNLALVSGSDHHGWGYAAAGWTLLHIEGWRGGSPTAVSTAIIATIRRGGHGSTRVVERYVAHTDGATLPFTVPVVAWQELRTLSWDERVTWIAWTLVLAIAHWARRRHVWRRDR